MKKFIISLLLSFGALLFLTAVPVFDIQVSGKNAETNLAPEGNAVFTELDRLVAPEGMGNTGGDRVGRNVAISGNTIIVGAADHNNNQGAAYVFVRTGETWTFQQKLVSSDEAFKFGYSVAISGDTVLVGAPGAFAPVSASGAVYVFTRSGASWTQQQKLFTGTMETSQNFGASIAMTGNTAIIGSPGDTIGANSQQGSAYIYTGSGSSWGFQARITASDGTAGDNFGGDSLTGGDVGARRVAISGDTVIVGAAGGIFGIREGSAYVFTRSGTSWTEQQKLTAFDAAAQDAFGFSVDISGNSLIVGAAYDDIDTRTDAGSAYVFTRNGSVWTLQQKLIGDDDNPGGEDNFGTGVAISGDTALVGAPGEDIIPFVSGNGGAFLFKRTGTIWTNRAKFTTNLQITPNPSGYRLGTSVALGGNTAVAGVPLFTTSNGFVGAAYVFNAAASNSSFDFDGDGKSDIGVFRPSGGIWYLNQSFAGFSALQFGLSTDKITPADYDGDGRTDIAVWRESDGNFYYLRSSTGTIGVFQWGTTGDKPVSADYDGDGRADLAVFRPSTGTWWILQTSDNQARVVRFGQTGDVPLAADFDGDGNADISVFRPAEGFWYSLQSANGYVGQQFGVNGDIPLPADYDGDLRADFAVFRPSNRTWYIARSNDNPSANFYGFAFGSSSDTPVPADYDGDGKTDAAIYRNGAWWILNSSNGSNFVTQFGISSDTPVSAAYLP